MKTHSPIPAPLGDFGGNFFLTKLQTLAITILALSTGAALAATNTWTGPTSATNWSDTTYWSLGHVPTSSEPITNSVSGAQTIVNANAQAGGIDIQTGAWSLLLSGANRTLTINGGLNVGNLAGANQLIEIRPYTTASTGSTFTLNGDITVSNTQATRITIGTVAGNVLSGQYTSVGNFVFGGANINLGSQSELVFNIGNASANLGLITFSGSGTGLRSISLRANGYTALNQTFNTTGLSDSSLGGTARIVGTTTAALGTNLYGQYTAQTAYSAWGGAPISHTVLAITNTANYSSSVWLTDGNRGTLSLTKAGAGTQTLSGNNDFTGSVAISGGTLKAGHNNALGFGGVNAKDSAVNGTTVTSGGVLDLGGFTVNEKITLNGGTLQSTGAGSTVGNGLAGLSVTASGADFTTSTRTLTFTGGGGSGATGVAVLGMTDATVNITAGTGSGWAVGDTIVVNGGSATRQAVIMVDSVSGGTIQTWHVADSGYGYTSVPANVVNTSNGISIPAGRTAPTFSFNNAFTVVGIQLTNAGSGYTSAPTVSVSGKSIMATAELTGTTLQGDNFVGGTESLNFASAISGSGNLTKIDSNTVTLSGLNTYTGDTTISSGTLILAENARQTFLIGASSGDNNQINGTGTLSLDGYFVFDLSGAGTAGGSSWLIVNVSTLSETFGSTFGVIDFNDNGDNTWSRVIGDNTYTFSESTGLLSVVPEPRSWVLFGMGLFVTLLGIRRVSSRYSR